MHFVKKLTLMIAESRQEEKEMMISVIMNCISEAGKSRKAYVTLFGYVCANRQNVKIHVDMFFCPD